MNKILKIVFNALLIVIIVLMIGYYALRFTNVIKVYNVETGSMEGQIHIGDYILIYQKKNYSVDDVVTYTVNNYHVTHRIIKMDGDKVITKGDANNREDEEINVNQIEGKVIYSGGILNFLVNYKFAIVAVLIAIYLISCYFEKDDKDKKDEESNNKE